MQTIAMFDNQPLPIRSNVVDAHREALAGISRPGTWLTAQQRVDVVRESRHAPGCKLCQARVQALSPYTLTGNHETLTELPAAMIEVVHRIATDSGRLTHKWFESVIDDQLSAETYVEVVGVVATSIILDSYATGLGVKLPELLKPEPGEPDHQHNPGVFDGGAWVPMLDVPQEATDTGLPTQPNIGRAMGLVPSAISLFFPLMRSHYGLGPLDLAIHRSQVELIAARVSSHNLCFY